MLESLKKPTGNQVQRTHAVLWEPPGAMEAACGVGAGVRECAGSLAS